MALQSRRGFTLVELLVVIVIITMLVGLLIPAVGAARARARRAQCMNNQRELGLALQQYESSKQHLPGYVNSFAGNGNLSWVIMILEPLGRADLWREARAGNIGALSNLDLPDVRCPSNRELQAAGLSYVVNCGLSNFGLDPTGAANTDDVQALQSIPAFSTNPKKASDAVRDKSFGLFFDRDKTPASRTLRKTYVSTEVTTDGIKDGASYTLMLTENTGPRTWAVVFPEPALGYQANYGALWWSDHPNLSNPYGPPQPGDGRMINDPSTAVPVPRFVARPASFHSGGALVTYADGHTQFQSEQIEYGVYHKLMIPDDAKALNLALIGN